MEALVNTLSINEFKEIIRTTVTETFQDNLEDIIALNSSNYLESIKEARNDYLNGDTVNLMDL